MLAACHQIIKHTEAILMDFLFWYKMMPVLLLQVVLTRETKYHTGAYMKRVHLDFRDYFRLRRGMGTRYVLFMVDQFTK